MSRWVALLAAFLSLCNAALQARQGPPPAGANSPSDPPMKLIPRTKTERDASWRLHRRMILNVEATDASGNPVSGLGPDDFQLFDGGKPAAVDSIRAVDGTRDSAHVHAIIVLDALNGTAATMKETAAGIRAFLSHGDQPLPFLVSLAVVSSSGVVTNPPSQDRYTLSEQLASMTHGLHNFGCSAVSRSDRESPIDPDLAHNSPETKLSSSDPALAACFDQRFRRSIESLEQLVREQDNTLGRAILIWTGPGWPFLSRAEFKPLDGEQKKNLFSHVVDVVNTMREAQVTLNAIEWQDSERELRSAFGGAYSGGTKSADAATEASLALPVLARMSGGQALDRRQGIAAALAACLADGEKFYAITFDPAVGTQDELHAIELKPRRSSLTVRTNTAYYAEP